MGQACIFCSKIRPLTREHVIPDWLRYLYKDKLLVTNKFFGNTDREWTSRIFQHKSKVVCAECNGGWMSVLEAKVKPILSKLIIGECVLLDEDTQSVLAFWTQKTTLMLAGSTPGNLKISDDVYRDLFVNNTYSKKVMVNMGWRMLFAGNKEEPIVSFQLKQIPSIDVPKELYSKVSQDKIRGGFVWKSVLVIGPIVFEMVGHNMNMILEVSTQSKVFKTIQPYLEDFNWPLEWPIEAEGGLDSVNAR